MLLYPLCLFSQVGINTTNPAATLDVEGNIRVAILEEGSSLSARDSILVMDGNQIVRLVSSKQIFSNVDNTLVKGYVNSGSSISLSSGNSIIPFSSTEFDIKNEFDTTTGEFIATESGIYKVSVQIKQDVVSVGDFGLSIYKVNTSGTETLIARERYVNLSLLGLNLSSPVRKVETLIFLSPTEKIRFKTNSSVGLTISTASSETFFIIEQVR